MDLRFLLLCLFMFLNSRLQSGITYTPPHTEILFSSAVNVFLAGSGVSTWIAFEVDENLEKEYQKHEQSPFEFIDYLIEKQKPIQVEIQRKGQMVVSTEGPFAHLVITEADINDPVLQIAWNSSASKAAILLAIGKQPFHLSPSSLR
jgi:hypothetical protein